MIHLLPARIIAIITKIIDAIWYFVSFCLKIKYPTKETIIIDVASHKELIIANLSKFNR